MQFKRFFCVNLCEKGKCRVGFITAESEAWTHHGYVGKEELWRNLRGSYFIPESLYGDVGVLPTKMAGPTVPATGSLLLSFFMLQPRSCGSDLCTVKYFHLFFVGLAVGCRL